MTESPTPSRQNGHSSRSPFDGFIQVGPQIYFHDTTEDINASSIHQTRGPALRTDSLSSPDLIILCTWMGAATKHIAKYTSAYLNKYPNARVLLVRSSIIDLTLRPVRWQVARMSIAVNLIQSIDRGHGGTGKDLKVLVHNFSNGGSWSAIMLAQAYKAKTGSQLPVSALINDSAPSLPSVRRAVSAMSLGLGNSIIIRLVGLTAIWFIIVMTYIWNRLKIAENTLYKLRRILNDPSGPFLGAKVPRLYICSQTDAMVPMHDVELHAKDARSKLQQQGVAYTADLVQIEEFQKSKHVGHMMVDPERYWDLVQSTWNKVQP